MDNNNNKRHTVVGIYDNVKNARKAEEHLLSDGFTREKVDISTNNTAPEREKGISSFFGSIFGDNDDARRHTDVAKSGTIVTVHTNSLREAEQAAAVLDKFGTLDINSTPGRSRTGAESATGRTTDTTGKGASIPIIEEEMQVGKREVTTGGVRLRSHIMERPVEEHLRLREEHINVDRRPVDRKATDADFKNFKEGTIEAKEHAEVPVVNKQARVVEEVNLNKEVSQHKETIKDTVRKTDVDVKNIKSEERNRDNKY